MILGYPKHVADYRNRQPKCEILDEIHVSSIGNPIERLIDDLLDTRPHVLDPARGECLDDKTTQSRVIGRILLQHPVPHAAIDRFLHDLGAVTPTHPLDKVLAEALVAKN